MSFGSISIYMEVKFKNFVTFQWIKADFFRSEKKLLVQMNWFNGYIYRFVEELWIEDKTRLWNKIIRTAIVSVVSKNWRVTTNWHSSNVNDVVVVCSFHRPLSVVDFASIMEIYLIIHSYAFHATREMNAKFFPFRMPCDPRIWHIFCLDRQGKGYVINSGYSF